MVYVSYIYYKTLCCVIRIVFEDDVVNSSICVLPFAFHNTTLGLWSTLTFFIPTIPALFYMKESSVTSFVLLLISSTTFLQASLFSFFAFVLLESAFLFFCAILKTILSILFFSIAM